MAEFIVGREIVSRPGAAVQVMRIHLSDEYRQRVSQAIQDGRRRSAMSTSRALSLVALVLAILSLVVSGYPFLVVAVILLAVAHLV